MASSIICLRCGEPAEHPNGVAGHCGHCGASLTSCAPATTPARPTAPPQTRTAVSAAHRKLCFTCGADVTFSRRTRRPEGGFQCGACARAAGMAMPAIGNADPRAVPPKVPAQESTNPLQELGESPEVVEIPPTRRAARRGWRPWIVAAGVVGVMLFGGILYAILRPTWEDQNDDRILAMRSDADASSSRGQPKEAYFQYKAMIDFVGEHEIHNALVKQEVEEAHGLMAQAYAKAKPIIDQAIAAEQEKQAELRRREDQRQLAAAAEKERHRQAAVAEKQRQEQARRDADVARQASAARRATETAAAVRRAAFQVSQAHAESKRAADGIVSSLAVTVASEDSAYRAISERSDAARRLLSIYVKMQGRLTSTDVTAEVDRITSGADSNLVGEDSAIRATSNYDQAFFDLLGVWCRALGRRYPNLPREFSEESSSVRLRLAGDDSAVREISGYTRASMVVLESIVAAESHAAEAKSIVASAQDLDSGDDSAWRNTMHHTEANMSLLLVLLANDHPDQATKIKTTSTLVTSDDGSALRAQSQYLQGTVEALQRLIRDE